jgi:hypothetical protein
MEIIYNSKSAVFTDENKTHVSVNALEKSENGDAIFMKLIEVSPNPVFDEFVKQVSLEQVEENTKKYKEDKIKSINKEVDQLVDRVISKISKEQQEVKTSIDITNLTTDELFKLKIQSFEIADIKKSTNKPLKAKIRKAETFIELLAYSVATILDSANTEKTEVQENTENS